MSVAAFKSLIRSGDTENQWCAVHISSRLLKATDLSKIRQISADIQSHHLKRALPYSRRLKRAARYFVARPAACRPGGSDISSSIALARGNLACQASLCAFGISCAIAARSDGSDKISRYAFRNSSSMAEAAGSDKTSSGSVKFDKITEKAICRRPVMHDISSPLSRGSDHHRSDKTLPGDNFDHASAPKRPNHRRSMKMRRICKSLTETGIRYKEINRNRDIRHFLGKRLTSNQPAPSLPLKRRKA